MKKESKPARHPVRNVKLVIEYDGTDYCGWQSQTNGVTIQAVLEKCVKRILGKRVPVVASGRTDAGVHAMAQVANVKGSFPVDDATLLHALNSFLPNDISISDVATVPDDFHAIRDARWKTYRYFIYNRKTPSALARRSSWFMPVPLDLRSMRQATKALVGEHDFRSFMASGSSVKNSVRRILSLEIKKRGGMVVVEVKANGFLKYMVRNIVGMLVEIGKGRYAVDDMKKVLDVRARTKAGVTAPPNGLFLVEVFYG